MLEKWTGEVVGRMHNERVTCQQLAEELGWTKSYISAILNGRRNPVNIENRIRAALERCIERKS